MNKRIRMMIDELFAGMKMTAENLALRDELMANAEARYDDALCQGRSETEAFNEVAESLSDVQALLKGMNAEDAQEAPAAPEEPQTAQQETDQAEKTGSAGTKAQQGKTGEGKLITHHNSFFQFSISAMRPTTPAITGWWSR